MRRIYYKKGLKRSNLPGKRSVWINRLTFDDMDAFDDPSSNFKRSLTPSHQVTPYLQHQFSFTENVSGRHTKHKSVSTNFVKNSISAVQFSNTDMQITVTANNICHTDQASPNVQHQFSSTENVANKHTKHQPVSTNFLKSSLSAVQFSTTDRQITATANNTCHTHMNESTLVTSATTPLISDAHPEYMEWLRREEIDRSEQSKVVSQIWEAKNQRNKGHFDLTYTISTRKA